MEKEKKLQVGPAVPDQHGLLAPSEGGPSQADDDQGVCAVIEYLKTLVNDDSNGNGSNEALGSPHAVSQPIDVPTGVGSVGDDAMDIASWPQCQQHDMLDGHYGRMRCGGPSSTGLFELASHQPQRVAAHGRVQRTTSLPCQDLPPRRFFSQQLQDPSSTRRPTGTPTPLAAPPMSPSPSPSPSWSTMPPTSFSLPATPMAASPLPTHAARMTWNTSMTSSQGYSSAVSPWTTASTPASPMSPMSPMSNVVVSGSAATFSPSPMSSSSSQPVPPSPSSQSVHSTLSGCTYPSSQPVQSTLSGYTYTMSPVGDPVPSPPTSPAQQCSSPMAQPLSSASPGTSPTTRSCLLIPSSANHYGQAPSHVPMGMAVDNFSTWVGNPQPPASAAPAPALGVSQGQAARFPHVEAQLFQHSALSVRGGSFLDGQEESMAFGLPEQATWMRTTVSTECEVAKVAQSPSQSSANPDVAVMRAETMPLFLRRSLLPEASQSSPSNEWGFDDGDNDDDDDDDADDDCSDYGLPVFGPDVVGCDTSYSQAANTGIDVDPLPAPLTPLPTSRPDDDTIHTRVQLPTPNMQDVKRRGSRKASRSSKSRRLSTSKPKRLKPTLCPKCQHMIGTGTQGSADRRWHWGRSCCTYCARNMNRKDKKQRQRNNPYCPS